MRGVFEAALADARRGWTASGRDLMVGALCGLAVSGVLAIVLVGLMPMPVAAAMPVVVAVQLVVCYVLAGWLSRSRDEREGM